MPLRVRSNTGLGVSFGGNTMAACKYGDTLCPCQDGDQCHYEGKNPMTPPRPEFIVSAMGDMVFDGDEWYEELLADWRAQRAGSDA